MTGNYEQMLPLLASCFCAYAVAEYMEDPPIYEALLERDLLRGGSSANEQVPFVVEFEVEPGAPFMGREVRELGLPSGCVSSAVTPTDGNGCQPLYSPRCPYADFGRGYSRSHQRCDCTSSRLCRNRLRTSLQDSKAWKI